MIETFFTALVNELGATGLLLIGFFLILLYAAKEISRPLKVINREIGEIRDLLKEGLALLKR